MLTILCPACSSTVCSATVACTCMVCRCRSHDVLKIISPLFAFLLLRRANNLPRLRRHVSSALIGRFGSVWPRSKSSLMYETKSSFAVQARRRALAIRRLRFFSPPAIAFCASSDEVDLPPLWASRQPPRCQTLVLTGRTRFWIGLICKNSLRMGSRHNAQGSACACPGSDHYELVCLRQPLVPDGTLTYMPGIGQHQKCRKQKVETAMK